MRVRKWIVAGSLCLLGLSCAMDEPDPELVKVTTDPAGAQKTVGKISEVAMSAFFVRIKAASREYVATQGSYPDNVQQLVDAGLIHQSQVNDPWGNPFALAAAGGVVTVISYGADGKPGGTGDNRDRTSSN